ncbi:DUF4124 domain-containing protein [Oxalobacteraceae bacterium]|nr:DUF4124 domain-containing protein [Oxalobacteraceae bacterium]
MSPSRKQRGFSLLQVAICSAALAAIAMAALFSMRYERNFFSEGLAKLTGKPLPPRAGEQAKPGKAGAGAGAAAAAAAASAQPAGVLRKCVIDGKTVFSDTECGDSNPTSKTVKVQQTRGIESPKVAKPEAEDAGSQSMRDKMIEKTTR